MAESFVPLIQSIEGLRREALAHAERHEDDVERVPSSRRCSALNLLHYLALRQHDLRELQQRLTGEGLSSLGRLEAHALAGIEALLATLRRAQGAGASAPETQPPVDHAEGRRLLEGRAEELLGPSPEGRSTRIMVTMPSEAATEPDLVRELVAAGMDVMRVNSAHDDQAAWQAMASHLARAREATGRRCLLQFDLAGPKLRTGALPMAERVVHWRPPRDHLGRPRRPVAVRLVPVAPGEPTRESAGSAAMVLPVEASVLAAARVGDELRLTEYRGRKRSLRLVREDRDGAFVAEGSQGVYIEACTEVALRRSGRTVALGKLGLLPGVVPPLELKMGDRLVLTRDPAQGRHGDPESGEPARIPCTLPQVFEDVEPGHRVWLDDGKFGGRVLETTADSLTLEITHAAPGGGRLRPEKGINLPDTLLRLPALTDADLACLDFAAAQADIVGMSFVRTREDIDHLREELERRGGAGIGIMLKIETSHGFAGLADLLLSGLRWPRLGVMVARGDLAVEVGFERLAEAQEEMLWLCEAAHVPVTWATQVLDTLARTGLPSRAEVTDAAMAERAECVMLNKGPHVIDAVRFLDNVLRRMEQHQAKKSSLLRPLSISHVHHQGCGT
jgi:pyruvate kinase